MTAAAVAADLRWLPRYRSGAACGSHARGKTGAGRASGAAPVVPLGRDSFGRPTPQAPAERQPAGGRCPKCDSPEIYVSRARSPIRANAGSLGGAAVPLPPVLPPLRGFCAAQDFQGYACRQRSGSSAPAAATPDARKPPPADHSTLIFDTIRPGVAHVWHLMD